MMTLRGWVRTGLVVLVGMTGALAGDAQAQSMGTFTWQLEPFCNRVVVEVIAQAGGFRVAGTDNQCGFGPAGTVTGSANVAGSSVELRMHILVPGVRDVHVTGIISLGSLSGTWSDSGGRSGAMTFNGSGSGTAWPSPALPQQRVSGSCAVGSAIRAIGADGTVTCETSGGSTSTITGVTAGTGLTGGGTTGSVSLAVNTAQIQQRVSGSCAVGSAIRTIASDGSVTCEADDTNVGTLTGVTAGAGLTGGGTSGAVSLAVTFSGSGAATSAARGDHDHSSGPTSQNAAIGLNTLKSNTTGYRNTAVGYESLKANTEGNGNEAYGALALASNTTGFGNTAIGSNSMTANTFGYSNVAVGSSALLKNTTGRGNTAVGPFALQTNVGGLTNTAIGNAADVASANLMNATAIGAGAIVDASNKVQIGNSSVSAIVGPVAFTSVSDRRRKERFRTVDGEDVLMKMREVPVTSWNYIGHDPAQFRHYGPMAQDFFATFGNDGVGAVGNDTTINSGDLSGLLWVAMQAVEQRTTALKARNESLEAELSALRATVERLQQALLTVTGGRQ